MARCQADQLEVWATLQAHRLGGQAHEGPWSAASSPTPAKDKDEGVGVLVKEWTALEAKAKELMEAGKAEVHGVVPVENGDLENWANGRVEEFIPGHQEICLMIKEIGLGVCSSCRWSSGGLQCSFAKAVRYYRDVEAAGMLGEGCSGRGRGKGRGRSRGRLKAEPKKGGGTLSGGGGRAQEQVSIVFVAVGVTQ